MRRLARWLGYALLALLALLLIAVIGVAIWLKTDSGRNYVRRQIIAAVADEVTGAVEIDDVQIGLGGRVLVRGVRLHNGAGQLAISVESITVECDLLPLISDRIRCPSLVIDYVWVHESGLEGFFAPGDDDKSDQGGGSADVKLHHIQLRHGNYRRADGSLAEISATGGLRLAGGVTKLEIAEAEGVWKPLERALTLRGVLVSSKDGLVGTQMAALSERSKLTVTVPGPDHYALSGQIGVEDVPWESWRADLAFELGVDVVDVGESPQGGAPGAREGTRDVRISGRIAAADTALELQALTVSLAEVIGVRGGVKVSALDPAALITDAPGGDLAVAIHDIEVRGTDPRTLTGRGSVAISGRIDDEEVTELALGVDIAGGEYRARLELDTPRGRASARARARMQGRGDDALDWHVERLSVTGDVTSLVSLVPDARADKVEIDALAHGAVDALAVTGEIRARGLHYGDVGAAFLDLSARLPRLSALSPSDPAGLAGEFELGAAEVRQGQGRIGHLGVQGRFGDGGRRLRLDVTARDAADAVERARARVTVALEPRRTRIGFGHVEVATSGIEWSGDGGSVIAHDSGRLDLGGIALESAAGRLELDGRIDAPGVRGKRGLHVRVERLDLARLAPLTGQALSGVVELDAQITQPRGRPGLDGSLGYRGVRWRPGEPALSGDFRVGLQDGRLAIVGGAKHDGGPESASVDVAVIGPRDPLDTRAWSRLDLDAIEHLVVEAGELRAEMADRYLAEPLGARGTVAVRLELPESPPGGSASRQLGLRLAVSGGAYGDLSEIDAVARAAWAQGAPGGLAAEVDLGHGGAPVTTATVSMNAPLTALVDGGGRIPPGMKFAVDAPLRDFDLGRLSRAGFIIEPISGSFSGDLRIRAEDSGSGDLARTIGEDLTVELVGGRGRKIRVAGVTLPVVEVSAGYDGDAIRGRLVGVQAAGGRLSADGRVVLADRTVTADIAARRFDLAILRAFAPDAGSPLAEIAGTISTGKTIQVRGPLDAPTGRGSLTLDKGALLLEGGTRRVANIRGRVTLAGDRVLLDEFSAVTGDGRLGASGEVLLAGLSPKSFTLETDIKGFPYIAGEYLTVISARSTITGTSDPAIEDGIWDIDVPIRAGSVQLADMGRELQDIGALADVEFVDWQRHEKSPGGAAATAATAARPLRMRVALRIIEPVEVRGVQVEAKVVGQATAAFADWDLAAFQGRFETQEGSFQFLERRYRIEEGWAEFDGPLPLDPSIHVKLARTFPAATVYASADGKLSEVDLRLDSDAGFDKTQILAIMLGEDPNDPELATRTAQDRISGAALSYMAQELRSLFGLPIDVIRLHGDGWELGTWTKVLGQEILVGYRYRDTDDETENRTEFDIEIPLGGNLSLEGRFGDNNIGGADIVWTIRF